MSKFYLLIFVLLGLIFTPFNTKAQEAVISSDIDFLWQGEVYTHPFYKGKSLWTKESRITITAIPNIPGINRNDLTYKWSQNGVVLGTINGVGNNSITFLGTVFGRPEVIKLEVFDSIGNLVGSKVQQFTPTSPTVLVYENNPLFGFLFNKSVLDSFGLKENEITFTAFPSFFAVANKDVNFLSYRWSTKGQPDATTPSATYRIPEGTSGSSSVSLSLINDNKISQVADIDFLVKFGQ